MKHILNIIHSSVNHSHLCEMHWQSILSSMTLFQVNVSGNMTHLRRSQSELME